MPPPRREHEAADLVAVGVGRVDDADDRAVVQHGDPVGQLEELVEVLGDQQHAGAGRPLLEQQLLGPSGGGDVEAPARVGRHDERAASRRGPAPA